MLRDSVLTFPDVFTVIDIERYYYGLMHLLWHKFVLFLPRDAL